MSALHVNHVYCDVILVVMFFNSNWSCLLIAFIEECTDYCQTQIQQVLSTQQIVYENCLQMIAKEQWPPNNSPNLNTIEISCLGSHIRSYFETFIRSPKQFLPKIVSERKVTPGEDIGQFSAGAINKSVRSFINSVTESVKSDGTNSEHFLYPKSVHTFGVRAVLNS